MISVYASECFDHDNVIRRLRALGRTVYSPRELGNRGREDELHLQTAPS